MSEGARNVTSAISGRPTVSAGYARALLEFAVSRGAVRSRLLAASGLDEADLVDQDRRAPMVRYMALMREAKAMCGEPALALHFSEATRFEAFSIVGLICQAAETMGEALRQLSRFRRLIAEVDAGGGEARFQLVSEGAELWLEDRRPDPNAFPELTESALSRFVCEFTRSHGDAPFVTAAHFTHPRPDHAAEYERIFRAPVRFEADRNALRIDPAWLSTPTHGANRYVFGVFNERAEALMKRLEDSRTVQGQVVAVLIPRLHRGDTDMATVATLLNMSRPTLYRRLKDEGVSFAELLDALRCDMAKTYLSGGRLSVNETAYLLGFSEPSAFSRSFKRWTGTHPRGWKAGA